MQEKKAEADERLALITEMIRSTRERMERNAGRPLLVWGYVTVAVTLAVWAALAFTGDAQWNLLWIAIPLLGGVLMRLTRSREPEEVRTYIDRVIGQIWLVLGLTAFSVGLLAMFCFRLPILFLIILLMGIGTTLTGLVIRFRPGTIGGAAGIVLSVASLAVQHSASGLPYVIFAGAFVVMMIVPGHLLNHRANRPGNDPRHV